MLPRGAIRNREYANQVKDYSGLLYGKITPTDLDGIIDFGNKAWVLIELKHIDADLPRGQRLAIERLADLIWQSGRPSLVLVAVHNTDADIDVAMSKVVEYRYHGKWNVPPTHKTVRGAIDGFLEKCGLVY